MAGIDRGVFSSLGGDGSLVAAVANIEMMGPGGVEADFSVTRRVFPHGGPVCDNHF
jgi:hypothetical protein